MALDRSSWKVYHDAYVGEIAPYLGYESDPWVQRNNPHLYDYEEVDVTVECEERSLSKKECSARGVEFLDGTIHGDEWVS